MKRLVGMLCAILIIFTVIPMTAHAEGTVILTITADKSTLNPGDVVNFTVSIGKVDNLGGLELNLLIPSGLTMMDETVTIPEGLAETLDSDGDIVKPRKDWLKWSYSAQSKGYTGNSELTILIFSCKAESDISLGSKSVGAEIIDCFDNSPDLDEYEVTVKPADLNVEKVKTAVTSVSLNKTALTLKDGESAVLAATVLPEDASNKAVTWSSDNEAVATVTDGTVTAIKGGTANITVTAVDGNQSAVCAVTVVCEHVMTKVNAVEATCEKDGNIEYFSCSKCGKAYEDEEGKTEIADTKVSALGHKPGEEWFSEGEEHWKVCTVCSSIVNLEKHTYELVVDKPATEDEAGTGHEECECGAVSDKKIELPKLDHTHTGIQHVAAVKATCIEEGNIEYWTCSSPKCAGKYYKDAECQIAVDTITVPKDPNNHVEGGKWVYEPGKRTRICLCGAALVDTTPLGGDTLSANVNESPSTPSVSANKASSTQASIESKNFVAPKTDDERTMVLYIAIGLVAVAAVAGVISYNRKRIVR